MKTTRKQFVATVAASFAAAALRSRSLSGAGSGEVLDARGFKALLGETFRFRRGASGGPVDLVLIDYVEAPPHSSLQQFTLTFAAPGGEKLAEGTYSADGPRGTTTSIFVIPVGRDAKGQALYRADFNLLLAASGSPTPVHKRN